MRLYSKFSLLFYLVSLGAMLILGWYGYQNAKKVYTESALEMSKSITNEISVHISDFLQLSFYDLSFIANNYATQRLFYWMDIGAEEKHQQYHQLVGDTLRGYAMSYPYYLKIRFIMPNGMEHIEVRRDSETSLPKVIPENELKSVSDSDFFLETMKIAKGQIFTSALDLDTEHGQLLVPHIPVVRFATPLIGGNNVKYGVAVSNIMAEYFFRYIRAANQNEQGRVFYLISPNGDYLFHPDAEKCFGSQLGSLANFEQDFPHLLALMKKDPVGNFFTAKHIVTYQTIYPNPYDKKNYWLLVGAVPEAVALAQLLNFEYSFIGLALLVICLVFVITRHFLGNLIAPLKFVTQQLQLLGRGEMKVETLAYAGQDELKEMLDSTQVLMSNMEHLALQADAISKGDFSGQVNVLSENDRLGFAVNNMIRMLQTAKQTDQNRNWLRDGLEQLSKALTGDLTPSQLAYVSISLLGRYLQAGRGVFYNYNNESQSLDLLGSYMYSQRNHIGSSFKLGEGAIGQVAREKMPIFLTVLNQEQAAIVTGTNASTPLYTYTYPLLHDEFLLGVIELASFIPFNELKHTFLEEASSIIASFLHVVQQREQIKKLLVISEQAEKEALSKSVSLQEANQLMEEQQLQLQQQTEELQQSNAQMEEQQQQLQQQTEELRQSNAQMEETQQQMEQQNQQLRATKQELDARAKQLELASQYKSEFLANMSHELRTPLNSIILLSKMMASNDESHLSDGEVRYAEVIHNAGQELLRLINDVLDLSKIEAGQMEVQLETISTQELFSDLYELFEHNAKERTIELKLQDNLHGKFVSDVNKLSQILRNLLSNALKFTNKGSITLSVERDNSSKHPLRFSVKDTGIGIPEEKRNLIFEAFAQADGSISRQYGGTGLGLSISLRFVQLLGGVIELKSEVGQGSEFTVLLPDGLVAPTPSVTSKITPLLPATAQTQAPIDAISDDREQLSPEDSVILLIDDDPAFAQVLLEINQRLGYKTLLATTGKEGLSLAQRYKPNGILLDLGLPDMDGSEVLHEIKTQHALAAIPVYIVSGREKDAALLEKGLLGYLQKPVNVEQISQAVVELLTFIKQSSAPAIVVIENGGISADYVSEILKNQTVVVLKASSSSDLESLLSTQPCCLAIIDLEGQSVSQALEIAKRLRQIDTSLHFVFFGQQALSDEEEAQIYPYSDTIIIKTPQFEVRLLKNIERFLTQSQHHLDNSTTMKAKKPHLGDKRLQGKHILVVDDDARNLFAMTAVLEKEGVKVNGALNGKKALEFLQKQAVDMVFMDIMMPEMDGYQTIAALRSHPALAKIPVIVLTAKALSSDRQKALDAGADDYLAKPTDYEELINMAMVWCEKHA
jgi:signal transduction histidine kinase/CheY-like chemotaxis protein